MVSAIIPARNEEASIARAVESVAAQPEIGEVIVVDDQSTDRTGAILAELAFAHTEAENSEYGRCAAAGLGRQELCGFNWCSGGDGGLAAFSRTRIRITFMGPLDGRFAMPSSTMRCWCRIRRNRKWAVLGARVIPFVYCRLANNFRLRG